MSLLITHSWNGTVKGLKEFPPEDQPPVHLPFFSFRIMAGIGFLIFFLMSGLPGSGTGRAHA